MIFKEEEILLPMAEEYLTQDEWLKIQEESDEIGYALSINLINGYQKIFNLDTEDDISIKDGLIRLETGLLSLKQLEAMLNTLPVDITFIDDKDIVRYFSHGKERIFARTKTVIGRTVQNCHPQKCSHSRKIISDFRSGKKDYEDFY